MDALIFDFDGVIVDSEPVHLACFRQVLQSRGVPLSAEDYYTKYLGFDDHDCFMAVVQDHGKTATEQEVRDMTAAKTALVKRAYAESIQPLPGAVELARSARAAGVPTAICSGGLRQEIELAAKSVGARDCFMTIIAAEDVAHGKPDPEGYRLALQRLGALRGRRLRAGQSIVVEDAPAGIQAAKSLGMKVLAVTNSYTADALSAADRVVSSLAEVKVESLGDLLVET